jgi:hypothetical protein
MFHATLANATDLDIWARRLDARSQLPRLLRLLIHATMSDVQKIGFPADEGVQLGGWDGIVQAATDNAFVPLNTSVWEVGATSDVKGKADDDYEKRSQQPQGLNPADTVFVFVTPRRWGGKDAWIQARNAEGIWREVRAYDAEDLAQWLELAPAVHLWLSSLLGKHPQGALALDNFWSDWAGATNPRLNYDLVIGGRDKAREHVLAWLRGSPSAITLQGDSTDEATAFLAAVVQSLDADERSMVMSRTVIVDDVSAWRTLALSSTRLILVARFDQPDAFGRIIQNGHHVFVPLGRSSSGAEFTLPRLRRDSVEQALKNMGLSDDRRRDLATLARRSLSALRRKLAVVPGVQSPQWSQPNAARSLLAPLLVGTWQDVSEGDRGVLSTLAAVPYDDVQQVAVRWANESDPAIRREGDIWMVAAREDAWRLIARYLTADDLRRFESVALDVLGECDPALDLPHDKRFAASIYGKVLTRSGQLREGIAETLALMAALSNEVEFATGMSGEDVARKIVRALFEEAKGDEELWASISYYLPLLAEAEPGVFLDAVEAELTGDSPMLPRLFQDQTDSLFGSSSPHTGLLWALETLAWSADYLGRASLCLASLARLDPGGRLGNRPAVSLRDIFLCWYPNTTAPLHRRLAVIDALRKREPEVAWRLLIHLLPDHHSSVSPTHGTRWRDWVPNDRTPTTVQEYIDATDAILERLLSDAQAAPLRWCDLIASADGMTTEQRELFLKSLENLDESLFSSDGRAQLRDCLRKEIARHREYSDATWAMPMEQVDRMEQVYARFEPENMINRHLWLFDTHVDVPRTRHIEWEERRNVIEELRVNALRQILDTQGWEGILSLAKQVKVPAYIGATLGRSDLPEINANVLLQENLAAPEQWRSLMAREFVTISAYKYGESWVDDRLAATETGTWSHEQYGDFLLALPFTSAVLDRLDKADEIVQRYYWSNIQHIGLPEIASDADRVLTAIIKFERPHIAVAAIEWGLHHNPELVSPERIAEVLEACTRLSIGPNFDASSFAYNSAELLKRLEKTNLPRERLALLEWTYLRVHEHYRRPQILHEELSQNADFFVEVLQYAYRTKSDSEEEASEQRVALAHQAWDLLHSWKRMPGTLDDGTIDVDALRTWVIRARELAEANDQREIADVYIGHCFAFSPSDIDGAWPHHGVRDLIEELASTDIEDGWRTQIFNNRGVTMRMPTDGGEQERTLAQQYESYANQIRDQWPRTGAALQEVADNYRRHATQEDHRAALTEDFWR